MAYRDNVSKLGTVFNALALPVVKTTITGPSIRLVNYNAATLYINVGTWTDGTHTFIIQEAPDSAGSPGAWNTVATTDLVTFAANTPTDATPVKTGNAQPTVISSAATAVNQRIGYLGSQPWVRVVDTVTGSPATGCAYDAYWICGEPRLMPAAV